MYSSALSVMISIFKFTPSRAPFDISNVLISPSFNLGRLAPPRFMSQTRPNCALRPFSICLSKGPLNFWCYVQYYVVEMCCCLGGLENENLVGQVKERCYELPAYIGSPTDFIGVVYPSGIYNIRNPLSPFKRCCILSLR